MVLLNYVHIYIACMLHLANASAYVRIKKRVNIH